MRVHFFKMSARFGRCAMKTRGTPFSVMAHLKKIFIEVKAEENCLAHALLIAISRVDNDRNYNSYRRGFRLRPLVQNLLETTGIDLSNGVGIPEIIIIQEYFGVYKIILCLWLSC